MLYPIPDNCKKLPKNQLNHTNFLPVLQSVIEKVYFAANQTEGREQIQEIMELYLEDVRARQMAGKEEQEQKAAAAATAAAAAMPAAAEGANAAAAAAAPAAVPAPSDEHKSSINPAPSSSSSVASSSSAPASPTKDDAAAAAASSSSLKFTLPVTPPGSALLASHLHQLPALCKLYLLHFLCDYVLGEVELLREACTLSNLLAHGQPLPPGVAAPAAAAGGVSSGAHSPAPSGAQMVLSNPFHNKGLNVAHGLDDDGAQYWCFVHEEMARVHLWQDRQTGAKSEYHVRLRKKGSKAVPRPKVTGFEPDDSSASDDSDLDVDMLGDDEVEPIDEAHAPPTFNFTLLASDLDAVNALVSVWAVTWKKVDGLVFLHKMRSEVLPNALLHQKKLERLGRRDKSVRASGGGGLVVPEFVGMQRWSTRARKPVNYAEMAEGDVYAQEDTTNNNNDADEYSNEAPEEGHATRSSKRTRRSGPSPAPGSGSGSVSAGGSGSGHTATASGSANASHTSNTVDAAPSASDPQSATATAAAQNAAMLYVHMAMQHQQAVAAAAAVRTSPPPAPGTPAPATPSQPAQPSPTLPALPTAALVAPGDASASTAPSVAAPVAIAPSPQGALAAPPAPAAPIASAVPPSLPIPSPLATVAPPVPSLPPSAAAPSPASVALAQPLPVDPPPPVVAAAAPMPQPAAEASVPMGDEAAAQPSAAAAPLAPAPAAP
jgi:hypothetical protein